MLRVIRNYVHAGHLLAAQPAALRRASRPRLAGARRRPARRLDRVARLPGFLGENVARQLLRVVGENPFLLALPFAPRLACALERPSLLVGRCPRGALRVATILPPLRAFGPGRTYMKAAIFPTAYTLAAGIGTPAGLPRPLGRVTLLCLLASVGAIGFFFLHVRSRPTEQTASVPPGLPRCRGASRRAAPGGVFVLPYMYADYVAYWSGKPVVWGGHCGDHARFEWITPVITARSTTCSRTSACATS